MFCSIFLGIQYFCSDSLTLPFHLTTFRTAKAYFIDYIFAFFSFFFLTVLSVFLPEQPNNILEKSWVSAGFLWGFCSLESEGTSKRSEGSKLKLLELT